MEDAPPPEDERAGEPSSILQAPGENTLRKNFQAIQDSTKAAQAVADKAAQAKKGAAPVEQRRSSRKEEIPEPGPPARPPIVPGRLEGGQATPPGPPPQRPLPPPPNQAADQLRRADTGAAAANNSSKPSTPPNQAQRNSRLINQQQTPVAPARKPTDQLDELAKQLQDLVPSPGPPRQRDRQRVPSNSNPPRPPQTEDRPLVEDDSSDDEGPVLRDGTIEASVRNPKPLRELLPHRTSAVEPARPAQPAATPQGPAAPAKAGPSRPLPPTPDDEDTMRRGARGQMDSPGQGPHQHPPRTNMPDLLPQTPTSSASPGSSRPQGL